MMLPSFREWRHHRRAERELEAMTDRELADLGVSRRDIPLVVRGLIRR